MVDLLIRAFAADTRVCVLDPALGNGSCRSNLAWSQLLQICANSAVERLEVWTESGIANAQNMNRTPEQACDELKRIAEQQTGEAARGESRLNVKLVTQRHNGTFHDRFIGFGPVDAAFEEPWHAVAIGCGVCAFVCGGQTERLTTVARIPSKAFSSALAALERHRPRDRVETEFTLPLPAVATPDS